MPKGGKTEGSALFRVSGYGGGEDDDEEGNFTLTLMFNVTSSR